MHANNYMPARSQFWIRKTLQVLATHTTQADAMETILEVC